MSAVQPAPEPGLRTLYRQLATGLSQRERCADSVPLLRQALREAGDDVPDWRLHAELASCLETMGRTVDALEARLDAVASEPAQWPKMRPLLHALASEAAAARLGERMTGEWARTMLSSHPEPPSSLHLFLGRVHLLRGAPDSAIAEFEAARRTAGWRPEDADLVLAPAALPGELAREPRAAEARLLLARVLGALGRAEDALREVEAALEAGFQDDEARPDAPALRLRAELLAEVGTADEAADAFYLAGDAYGARNDLEAAADLLSRSLELRDPFPPAMWLLADYLYALATRPTPPFWDAAQLDRARTLWERTAAIEAPAGEFSWAYLTRAVIAEGAATLENRAVDGAWEAAVLAERCAALDAASAQALALLSRFHAALRHRRTALRLAEQALELDDQNIEAAQQYASGLWEAADERAIAVLEAYAESQPQLEWWCLAMIADLLALLGRPEAGLEHAGRAIMLAPDNPWPRRVRAQVLRLAGREDESRSDYAWLWNATGPGGPLAKPVYMVDRAWTAYHMGHFDEAEALFTEQAADPTAFSFNERVALACCALWRGDLDRADHLFGGALRHLRGLREVLDAYDNLHELETAIPAGAPARPAIDRYRMQLQRRELRLRKPPDPDAARHELEAALRDAARAESLTPRWLAAAAGLARLHVEESRWAEAVALYDAIARRDGSHERRFPEAAPRLVESLGQLSSAARDGGDPAAVVQAQRRLEELGATTRSQALREEAAAYEVAGDLDAALGRCREARDAAADDESRLRALEMTADMLLGANDVARADAACEEGRQLAARSRELEWEAHFTALAGCIRAADRDADGCLDRFTASADLQSRTARADLVRCIVEVTTGQRRSRLLPHQQRVLADVLTIMAEGRPGADPHRTALFGALWQLVRLAPQAPDVPLADAAVTAALPLVLQADQGLFPQGVATPEVQRMLDEDIPALQRSAGMQTGVQVPALMIYASNLPRGGYAIWAHGLRVVRGAVGVPARPEDGYAGRYAADAARCTSLGIQGRIARDPVEGADGMWLSGPADADRAAEAGIPVRDAYEFMLDHVGAIFRGHASAFLGVQEAASAVYDWRARAAAEDERLADAVLRDHAGLTALVRVLRPLLDEGAPISDLGTILGFLVGGEGLRPPEEAIERARAALGRSAAPAAAGR